MSNNYEQKEQEYKEYIFEHIANVQQVWQDIQGDLTGEYWLDDFSFFTINSLIRKHDKSKLMPEEFSGYRQWFYPVDEKEKNRAAFDLAWNRHQKANPHHWEFWVLVGGNNKLTTLDMPFLYIIEMLCDWTAMSYKFKDTPGDFYNKNRHKMSLSAGTGKAVERWLPIFNKAAEAHKQISPKPERR